VEMAAPALMQSPGAVTRVTSGHAIDTAETD
jgi:hypothetical protein